MINIFKENAKIAAYIFLTFLFLPLIWHALRYFLLAPLISKVSKCISILPKISGDIDSKSPNIKSQVSMEIALSEKEELLINQDYFQSNHKELKSKTKFFLFPTRPLTSILSRLFILTQVRVKNSKVQSLTSPKKIL